MNPHIQEMKEDVLYHLALGSGSHDLEKMFGDVKFVCMGGTPQRMKSFAGWTLDSYPLVLYCFLFPEYMLTQLGYVLPTGTCLVDISERSHRYFVSKEHNRAFDTLSDPSFYIHMYMYTMCPFNLPK